MCWVSAWPTPTRCRTGKIFPPLPWAAAALSHGTGSWSGSISRPRKNPKYCDNSVSISAKRIYAGKARRWHSIVPAGCDVATVYPNQRSLLCWFLQKRFADAVAPHGYLVIAISETLWYLFVLKRRDHKWQRNEPTARAASARSPMAVGKEDSPWASTRTPAGPSGTTGASQ